MKYIYAMIHFFNCVLFSPPQVTKRVTRWSQVSCRNTSIKWLCTDYKNCKHFLLVYQEMTEVADKLDLWNQIHEKFSENIQFSSSTTICLEVSSVKWQKWTLNKHRRQSKILPPTRKLYFKRPCNRSETFNIKDLVAQQIRITKVQSSWYNRHCSYCIVWKLRTLKSWKAARLQKWKR